MSDQLTFANPAFASHAIAAGIMDVRATFWTIGVLMVKGMTLHVAAVGLGLW